MSNPFESPDGEILPLPREAARRDGIVALLFPSRIGRLEYFLRGITAEVALALFVMEFSGLHLLLFWAVVGLIVLYWVVFIARPRIRDCGLHPATVILLFVPGVNVLFGLALLFKDSDLFGSQPEIAPELAQPRTP